MHLLVAINDNVEEWADATVEKDEKPRLPIPHAFGAAFINRGHTLSAVNFSQSLRQNISPSPFQCIYPKNKLSVAIKNVDLVTMWGGAGVRAAMSQFASTLPEKKVILNTYIWDFTHMPFRSRIKLGFGTRVAAHFTRAIVVMTKEQYDLADGNVPNGTPIINMTYGIDTAFYAKPSNFSHVPEIHRDAVNELLKKPYVIMPGDQLRLDSQALDIVERNDLRLVRIPQYASAKNQAMLKREIKSRSLEKRFIVFEKVNYPFLRFLIQHAAAYTALVDSTWQPAGWTVACEAMAGGLPVVMYEGLTSRELIRLGADTDFLRVAPMNNLRAFADLLLSLISDSNRSHISKKASVFTSEKVNLNQTSKEFVAEVERLNEG